MMRILFCNIAWMKEYRGNEDGKDIPLNGGSYVDETGDAHEKYNFTPVNMEGRAFLSVTLIGKILRYAIILSPSLLILAFLPDTDHRCCLLFWQSD